MKHMIRLLLLLLTLAGPAARTVAQDAEGDGGKSAGMSKKKQEKHLAKKERKDKKSLAKEEKALLKQHRQHQDKATQKRMKRNQRRADKHGQGRHRDPFFRRLFGSKH
jgi:hypothetical protein